MTWFERLTGFRETSPRQVRQHITVEGDRLTSHVNGKVMVWGRLETPSLAELRAQVRSGGPGGGTLSVWEVVADVQALHADISNAGALFQVASQFNVLEMVAPRVTPEDGVGIYEHDRTQGPACAIAAGAGTIYRNYFVLVDGHIGQSATRQIDCLADLGRALGNTDNCLWHMRNGYALASRRGLIEISNRLRAASEHERDALRTRLWIGIQWDTQVTLKDSTHRVSQAYCAALPVAFANHPAELWEDFARLVLEVSYEATLCAAIVNGRSTGSHRVYLTLLGGGAFGNDTPWITDGITHVLTLYRHWPIEVAIVSYGRSNEAVQQLVAQFPG